MTEDTPRLTLPQAADRVADILLRLTIPLYMTVEDRPWLCGTGFIVRRNRVHYLVSAAHVLDDAKTHGLFFYSQPNVQHHVTGRLLRSSGPERRDSDPYDVVVVRMEGDDMPPYRDVEKQAVDFNWLRPRLLPRTGREYLVIGFPQSKSSVSSRSYEVSVTSCSYRAASIDERRYEGLGLRVETQVAIHLDLKGGWGPDGQHRNFPRPQGMSGGPIFELWTEDGVGDPEIFPLVAVGIEHRKRERVLIGTDVSVVADMIQRLEADAAG